MLSAAVVSAQGWRSGRAAGNTIGNRQEMCMSALTDLTPEQKEKISQLVNAHQETIDELRTEQRSTFDPVKKNEIREEMLQNVSAHRNEVRNLLTEEQKNQYNSYKSSQGNRGRGFTASVVVFAEGVVFAGRDFVAGGN
jgi:Spy/CpxP family protein refolding chaperone